jgi:hypothetical protein
MSFEARRRDMPTQSTVYVILRQIVKASIFNTAVTANTNILSQNVTPSQALSGYCSIFRIQCCFDTAGVLSLVRTKGGTTITEQLNSGVSLNANCLYIFDFLVEPGESINLQYSVNATAKELKVVETAGLIT